MDSDAQMPFGKYKGWLLSEIPEAYLTWLNSLDDLRDPLRTAVDRELLVRHEPGRDQGRSTGPIGKVLDPEVAVEAERIVREGYRLAAMQSHPDRRGGSTVAMQSVNEAAATLRRWLTRVSPRRERRQSA